MMFSRKRNGNSRDDGLRKILRDAKIIRSARDSSYRPKPDLDTAACNIAKIESKLAHLSCDFTSMTIVHEAVAHNVNQIRERLNALYEHLNLKYDTAPRVCPKAAEETDDLRFHGIPVVPDPPPPERPDDAS